MVFYHKGLWVRKTPLPVVACARKAAILRVQIWLAHESDVVGLCTYPHPQSAALPPASDLAHAESTPVEYSAGLACHAGAIAPDRGLPEDLVSVACGPTHDRWPAETRGHMGA